MKDLSHIELMMKKKETEVALLNLQDAVQQYKGRLIMINDLIKMTEEEKPSGKGSEA